jgi:hypothetical protein
MNRRQLWCGQSRECRTQVWRVKETNEKFYAHDEQNQAKPMTGSHYGDKAVKQTKAVAFGGGSTEVRTAGRITLNGNGGFSWCNFDHDWMWQTTAARAWRQ